MQVLSETLRRAIGERQTTLAERIAELQGTLAGPRVAAADVLRLFAFFPEALAVVVEQEWNRNSSDDSRVQILRGLLRHATSVTNFLDEWLGDSSSASIPTHLLDSVERAAASLGLGDPRAVISAGPADNFVTVVRPLDKILFGQLGPLCPPVPAELVRPFVLMQAPQLEGKVARWHPIVLGHELAHLKVEESNALSLLDIQATVDMARAKTIPLPGSSAPGPASALRLIEIASNWAVELLCDAYAVHIFGAGAVAAMGEFLEVIGATDGLSKSHPPGRLRVHLMIEWLGTITDPRVQSIIAPWQELASAPISYAEGWAQFIVETLLARQADMMSIVEGWSNRYDTDAAAGVATRAAEALKKGIPPEPIEDAANTEPPLTPADVTIAAWIGAVEGFETPVDKLADKSLSDMGFLRRWKESGGSWPTPPASAGRSEHEAATLSAGQLRARLSSPGDDRLVVTPLLTDVATSASVDLRLGNSFIVFIRNRAVSFDPLDESQDPRQVQRSLQLNWGDKFVLHPAEMVLAATFEYLVLPEDLSAQVISRSSYGRLGLLSATAVQVHPHFHGCLTLELVNLGTVPLVLTPGERIAQLVLSPTAPVPLPPESKYHCPVGPEFSKVRRDQEAEILRTLAKHPNYP